MQICKGTMAADGVITEAQDAERVLKSGDGEIV